jgi:hypothetical protein
MIKRIKRNTLAGDLMIGAVCGTVIALVLATFVMLGQ